MACIYEDRMTSICSLASDNEGEYDPDSKKQGCDDCGVCVVSDDPDPSVSCDAYESDWECPECGTDLNNDECDCDQE